MTTPQLSLLVIRATDVERTVAFYRALGLSFERERHGSGPVHHAAQCGGTVFEVYPARPGESASASVRLGFCVPDVAKATANLVRAGGVLGPGATAEGSVVLDPSGNSVELTAMSPKATWDARWREGGVVSRPRSSGTPR